MRELNIGTPSAKQKLFMLNTHKYVGYGGSRGGGKSWAIQAKAKILCLSHAGIRCCIVRRTYPELETNHIRVLVPELELAKVGTYNKQDKRFTFINGSVIEFRFAQREGELNKFQGNQWDIIFVDEATQWSEQELKIIAACCRGVNNHPKRIYYTCNPSGLGHNYIKRIFIDRKYDEGESPDDYDFIQAKVTDNDALMKADPDYIRYLEALPPKLRQAWLDGDWNTLSGIFFEDFVDDPKHYEDHKWTHVIEPFDIPQSWTVERSYDFGYSKPFSLGYWAVSPEGNVYRILEWYGWNGVPNEGMKWTPDQQFKYIQELEQTHPLLKGRKIYGVADPAIWEASTGVSIAETAAKYHILFKAGDHKRISGWMMVHNYLQFDENGYPRMQFFNTCKAAIRTIPLMQHSETRVEDLNSDLEDHACDEIRYFAMSRPVKPMIKKQERPLGDDPLNMRAPKRKSVFISSNY